MALHDNKDIYFCLNGWKSRSRNQFRWDPDSGVFQGLRKPSLRDKQTARAEESERAGHEYRYHDSAEERNPKARYRKGPNIEQGNRC